MKHIILNESVEANEAEKVVNEYYEVSSQIKVLEKKKKELNAMLKDSELGEYQVGRFDVKLSERKVNRVDMKEVEDALALSGRDIEDFKKESSYNVLTVKPR